MRGFLARAHMLVVWRHTHPHNLGKRGDGPCAMMTSQWQSHTSPSWRMLAWSSNLRKAIFRVEDSNEWSRRKFRKRPAYLYAVGVWYDSDLVYSAEKPLIVVVIYGLRTLRGF